MNSVREIHLPKKTCETYTKGNIAFSKRNTFARKKGKRNMSPAAQ